MINFRFHLVSLIAVFLALTVGIVVGSTVVNSAIVDGLRHRIDTVEHRANRMKDTNHRLSGTVGSLLDQSAAIAEYAVDKRLTGIPVAVVAVRGVDGHRVDAMTERVRQAGAEAPVRVWLESRWVLSDEADRRALAAIVGPRRTTAQLRRAGLALLADRLAHPPGAGVAPSPTTLGPTAVATATTGTFVVTTTTVVASTTTIAPPTDSLAQLVDAGFVSLDFVDGYDRTALGSWPAGASPAPVLVVDGYDSKVPVRGLAAVLARSFHEAGSPTVVGDVYGDTETGRRAMRLRQIRSAHDLRTEVSTVDDLDLESGTVAAVLAVRDLVTSGVVGHYGIGAGASRPVPRSSS
jgi:copper transport outer membrane protein MctB